MHRGGGDVGLLVSVQTHFFLCPFSHPCISFKYEEEDKCFYQEFSTLREKWWCGSLVVLYKNDAKLVKCLCVYALSK